MKKYFICLIIPFITNTTFCQFIEPGVSIGINSSSGDLNRGYSPFPGAIGFEVFNRFNMSPHQSFKFSYKRGSITGKEKINDALSLNRNMWFKSKVSEISGKVEYNFLDYFDEIERENFTPYLFFGIGATILKKVEERSNKLGGKNRDFFANIPFGVGFKYLINKQFSLSFEIEFKKTFYDFLDNTSGANTSNINNVIYKPNTSVVKNYQYGSGNNNDFYYFTGISISYIFYKIPCPKDSAPYNSIY